MFSFVSNSAKNFIQGDSNVFAATQVDEDVLEAARERQRISSSERKLPSRQKMHVLVEKKSAHQYVLKFFILCKI